VKVLRSHGSVDSEFAKGGATFEGDYYVPLLAHAADGCKLNRTAALPITMDGLRPTVEAQINGSPALFTLEVHQGEGRGRAQFKFAVQHPYLARGAEPVTARVRQPHARAQAGIEDGLALASVDRMSQRLDGDLVTHTA